MAPRGGMPPRGGSRSKKCSKASTRPLKRTKNSHPGITIEPVTGPPPTYRQRTLDESSPIQSTSGSIADSLARDSSSTPTGGSHQSTSTHRRASLDDESFSGSSDHDDHDIDAPTGSDTVGGGTNSGSHRVRGDDRPISPPRPGMMKPKVHIYYGKLVGENEGDGVSRFFQKQIKKKIDAFWPYYDDIDEVLKDKLWQSFLGVYDLDCSPELGRQMFERENKKKWRNFLAKARSSALKKNKVNDVSLLSGTPCPRWLTDTTVWERYIQHWSTPEQRAISNQASKNRLSPAGRPEGKCSVHALGSKGLHNRMFEEEKRTGKTPSPLGILVDLNKKKDKATNEETGEVYDSNLVKAFEQYKPWFQERYGDDKDPLKMPWDKNLWMQTDPVKAGLGKGRVLGGGNSGAAGPLMEPATSCLMPVGLVEELKRKCAEEGARNKELKQKLETVEGQMVSVQSNVAILTSMVMKFMGGAGMAGGECNIPSAGSAAGSSSTATGLLAQMLVLPTPEAHHPPHPSQPPSQPPSQS